MPPKDGDNFPHPKWAEDFFDLYYREEILNLVHDYPDRCSLVVSFETITDPGMRELILDKPDIGYSNLNTALHYLVSNYDPDINVKTVSVELVNLPDSEKIRIRDIRHEHVGKLITLDGLVWKMTTIFPKVVVALFRCKRCDDLTPVKQDSIGWTEPYECGNDLCGKKNAFEFIVNESELVDFQRVKIQERNEDLKSGEQPQSILVEMSGALTGRVMLGNRVRVVAKVRTIQKIKGTGKKPELEFYLEAISILKNESEDVISVTPHDEKRLRELANEPHIVDWLVDSFAHTIYGLRKIKEGILLSAVGNGLKYRADGTQQREYIHTLICGDPGVAKTNLKHALKKVYPLLAFASGTGSRAAGLTAAVVQDSLTGDWVIEAGVLPLADGAGVVIDEFDKLDPASQRLLNDAMSNCQFEIDKAGLHAKLWSRAFVICLMNPKDGKFDKDEPFVKQVDTPADTLSRFDLIFLITDEQNDEKDTRIASAIFDAWTGSSPGTSSDSGRISIDDLQKYIALAQKTEPVFKQDDKQAVISEYLEARRKSNGDKLSVTSRHMEAILRISKAEAQLHLSPTVEITHIERAVDLINFSLTQASTDSVGNLDSSLLNAGVDKSQRDTNRIIRETIRKLQKDGGASLGDIALNVADSGITREKLDSYLSHLKRNGEIFQTSNEKWRLAQ